MLVAIAAEIRDNATGRIHLKHVQNPSRESLFAFVRETIKPGSELITDGAWGYDGLGKLGYTHRPTVLTGKGDAVSAAVLPRVHRIAALIKRWLLGTHQGRVSREQFGRYLDEFAFRFNRRSSPQRGQLFFRLIQQSVAVPPSSYRALVSVNKKRTG
jgi:transposase-like protein